MPLKTVTVHGTLAEPDGTPASAARIVAKLSAYETDNGVVVPDQVTEISNNSGAFTLQLWPNARGARGTKYLIDVFHGIRKLLSTSIVVPDVDYEVQFDDIVNAAPYPAINASQEALADVQAAAVDVLNNRNLAQQAAEDAQVAASAAQAAGLIFPDIASGLSEVQDGGYFSTPSPESDEYLILYRNESGAAVEIKRYPSQTFVDESVQLTYANRAYIDTVIATNLIIITQESA